MEDKENEPLGGKYSENALHINWMRLLVAAVIGVIFLVLLLNFF